MMYERKELPGYLGTEVSYPNGINGTFELAIDLPEFVNSPRFPKEGHFRRLVGTGRGEKDTERFRRNIYTNGAIWCSSF